MEQALRIIGSLSASLNESDSSHHDRKENEFLHSVLNSLSEGVIIADMTGKFQYFNASAKNILGLGSMDIVIDDWSMVYGCFHPDTVTPLPSGELPLAKALQGEEVFDEIIYIKNEYRSEGIYISISASPVKDSQGKIIGGTVIFGNVTKRKRAEISHIKSEARWAAQFKGIPIPTYIWQKMDNDFILIDYNKAAESITQNQIHDFKGCRLDEMYAHAPEVLEAFYRSMTQENEPVCREISYQMPNADEMKDFIVHFVKIPPDMVLVHTVDVTEMKNKEKELRKLSSAVEQTADSVVITDKNGTIEYVNPAFENTTGYLKNDISGRNISLLKSGKHDKKFYEDLWKTISSGNPYNGLIINRKKEGEMYWSEQTITPMTDADGQINHYVSVLRDITQARKQQEQEVQIRLAREVQSQLYKTDMSIKGLELSGSSIPAAETNGDYYDVLKINESTYSIIIGDVVGHGISSALIMAQTRAYLRAFTKHESDPGVLLTWLNQELVKDLDDTHFVTLVLVRIDLERRSMVYASAGHISGFLLNSSGETKQILESTGIPLGFMPDYQYQNSPLINLQPEDFFILLTDGIVEAHDIHQNEFGLEQALKVVRENRNQPIPEIQKNLHNAVLSFSSDLGQEDDITSVICKFQPDDEYKVTMMDCMSHAFMG